LRVETAGPSLEGCSSSVGAPKDFGTCAERLAHSRVSVTRFLTYIFSDLVVNAEGAEVVA